MCCFFFVLPLFKSSCSLHLSQLRYSKMSREKFKLKQELITTQQQLQFCQHELSVIVQRAEVLNSQLHQTDLELARLQRLVIIGKVHQLLSVLYNNKLPSFNNFLNFTKLTYYLKVWLKSEFIHFQNMVYYLNLYKWMFLYFWLSTISQNYCCYCGLCKMVSISQAVL